MTGCAPIVTGCAPIVTGCSGLYLAVEAGTGLAAGLLEEGDFREKINISVDCNTGEQ